VADRHLGLASLAFQEHVRPLNHPAHVAPGQNLQKDLVAHRIEVGVGNHLTADHEVPAHGVGHPADCSREEQQAQGLGTAGEQAPGCRPVRNPSSSDVPAGHGHVGTVVHGGEQVGHYLRRMLAVTVDHAEEFAPGVCPSAGHRGSQARSTASSQHP